MAPRGVPWPSRGVPWPLYEEYVLEDPYYIYLRLQSSRDAGPTIRSTINRREATAAAAASSNTATYNRGHSEYAISSRIYPSFAIQDVGRRPRHVGSALSDDDVHSRLDDNRNNSTSSHARHVPDCHVQSTHYRPAASLFA